MQIVRIRGPGQKRVGSWINILDPQHWQKQLIGALNSQYRVIFLFQPDPRKERFIVDRSSILELFRFVYGGGEVGEEYGGIKNGSYSRFFCILPVQTHERYYRKFETWFIRVVRTRKELVTLTFPTFSFFNRFFSLSRNCLEEGCGKPYLKVRPVPVGGGLRVHTNCAAGHKLKWESCDFNNQVLLGLYIFIQYSYTNKVFSHIFSYYYTQTRVKQWRRLHKRKSEFFFYRCTFFDLPIRKETHIVTRFIR